MAFPTSRETTYAAASQVKSADLNKIQDRIIGEAPIVVADITVTADNVTDRLASGSAHGLETGDGPFRLTTTGTIPTGLSTSVDYWINSPFGPTGTAIALALNVANALAGTTVTFTTNGTGTLKLVDTATTTRVYDQTVHRDLGVNGTFSVDGKLIAQTGVITLLAASVQIDGAVTAQAAITAQAAVQTSGTLAYFRGHGARAAAPASGAHIAGEIVFNADPVASGKIGWVCVTAGTPGTWKAFGAIDA